MSIIRPIVIKSRDFFKILDYMPKNKDWKIFPKAKDSTCDAKAKDTVAWL